MSTHTIKGRVFKLMVIATLAGGSISVRGCSPSVRDTLLNGLQTTANALTNTLVQTFFTALQQNDSGTGGAGLTTT